MTVRVVTKLLNLSCIRVQRLKMCGSLSQLYIYLQLVRLVENSAVLGRLEVLSGDPAIGDGLEELGALIRRRNW